MKTEHFKFIQNTKCEYFPCHKTNNTGTFNCLFCYCPLYGLKNRCGGNFHYLENGIKDCSDCMIPHSSKGYEHVMCHIQDIIELGKSKQ